ncbi:MAG: hypothetical protein QOJ25_1820 [Solirubrobacteraceae bacterium]|nr:hypothetical protein [Solirubrobacteraceae bacterium]
MTPATPSRAKRPRATFIGVRHHSPACARLVRDAIRELRPAHVLIEGPSDMNDRLAEVLLDHTLPVAVFTSYRDEHRHHSSWTPLCGHSPEWVALTEGRAADAEVRFVDLPAWHPAFAGMTNRYSDAERRHADTIARLCEAFAVDNVDTLWDHLFEVDPGDGLAAELEAYFDLVRGDEAASDEDGEREAYMASWVRAAVADAGTRAVVVVTGGFHRPALIALTADGADGDAAGWPEIPAFPPGAVGGSYLVPFSFKRLDAFDGYQSGMPSPRYYQRLWEAGAAAAGDEILRAVVDRLRQRRQQVSTADLVAARTLSHALARLRGHPQPSRADVLDGLVSALVTDALDRPLPWTTRGRLAAGTEPVVVEMVAALAGDVVGRLHPDTPHPPLVHAVEADLERHRIPTRGRLELDLTAEPDLARSRVLHRLRLLSIPGVERQAGPAPAAPPTLTEQWELERSDLWLPALIEAGSYGATLEAAATAALGDAFAAAGSDPAALAAVLFDAALCGLDELSEQVLAQAAGVIGRVTELGGLGVLLATALGLWRHDRLFGAAGSAALAGIIDGCTMRGLWLVEGILGGPAPADEPRIRAVVALRDAILYAGPVLRTPRDAAAAVFARSAGPDRPPDLRGASVGVAWGLAAHAGEEVGDALERAVRGASRIDTLGDFLAGLFALAREHVLTEGPGGVLGVLDEVLSGLAEDDFLVGLPSLRLAFSWFPPREREAIAAGLLERRGVRGSARSLLRLAGDPEQLARARGVEARVEDLLDREALLARAPETEPGDG